MTAVVSFKIMIDAYYTKSVNANCNTCHIGSWAINREPDSSKERRGSFPGSITSLLKRLSSLGRHHHSAAHTIAG
jgi:hypothetical protein